MPRESGCARLGHVHTAKSGYEYLMSSEKSAAAMAAPAAAAPTALLSYAYAKCVREFCSTDLNSCLQRYAQNVENPHYKDMVEATFECFEALLNYRGKLSSLTKSFLYLLTIIVSFTYTHAHVAVARKVLEANIESLIKIATHEHYESNSVVNICCKNILLKECDYLKAGNSSQLLVS